MKSSFLMRRIAWLLLNILFIILTNNSLNKLKLLKYNLKLNWNKIRISKCRNQVDLICMLQLNNKLT